MDIREGVLLSDYSTFHIGGAADYFMEVETSDALQGAIQWARIKNIPWHVIGEGSNILFADAGVRGLVIKNCIRDYQVEIHTDGLKVRAGAGMVFDDLVADIAARGVWGLENLSAIPGTVGATPVQNVGAYGVEIASFITAVIAYDTESDAIVTLAAETCAFGYRHSLFKQEAGKRYAIVAVELWVPCARGPEIGYQDLARRFEDMPREELSPQRVRDAVIEIRRGKFPDWHEVGTAGSFFKNPVISRDTFETLKLQYANLPGHAHGDAVKIPLGWILDHVCHLRGVHDGNVATYEKQALVIVAARGATAEDVIAFAKNISARVYEHTQIAIEWEVTYKM